MIMLLHGKIQFLGDFELKEHYLSRFILIISHLKTAFSLIDSNRETQVFQMQSGLMHCPGFEHGGNHIERPWKQLQGAQSKPWLTARKRPSFYNFKDLESK